MSFLGEIKRRKIFQVAAVYAVVAWLLIQIVATVEEPLNLPDWFDTMVIVLLAVGFPITLVISWAFNLTPEGLVKEGGASPSEYSAGRRIEQVLMGLLALAVVFLLIDNYVLDDRPKPEPVSDASQTVESAANAATAVPDVLPNSIAVLPFANLSPDPDNAFFAAGIHESILNQLAKISSLAVIARTSVLQYAKDPPPIPDIAAALRVQTVLEGSVRYADGQVVITAQLIDGSSGAHMWSEQFDHEFANVLAIQSEVAVDIARALRLEMLPAERARIEQPPTVSWQAFEHYLRALSLPDWALFPEYRPAYIDSLERAIRIDPAFADAYAALAHGYYSRGDRELAAETARMAIELNPTEGRAYDVLGVVIRNYATRLDEARAAAERAVELSPNDPWILTNYAALLAEAYSEYDEAIRVGKRAIAVDPDGALPCPCGGVYGRQGSVYLEAGDFDAAATHLQEAMRYEPDAYLLPMNLAIVEYSRGDRRAAKDNLEKAVGLMSAGSSFRLGYVAYLYGLLGEPERAAEILARQDQDLAGRGGNAWRPLGWTALGTRDKERALREWTVTVIGYLDEGRAVSPGRIGRFRDNWLNDPMLEEPEFLELRRRLVR
jgi:TolB-like protein/Tfp pilus assembly protein PilF